MASGEDKESEPTPTATAVSSVANNDVEEEAVVETEVEPVEEDVELIQEMVLVDQDGVLIKALSIEDGTFGDIEVKLYIENNSTQPITVQTRDFSVNGIMVDPIMSTDVAQDKKASDGISIFKSELEGAGIEKIANIEFTFHIFNTDSWDTIFDTDLIKIDTSLADSYIQEYDITGEVLYDANGIKIVYQGLSKDGFLGPEVNLYIENSTDSTVTIQTRDTSVNGFMIDPILSSDVVPGKKAYDEMTFMSSNLEESNITEIEEIELSFHIFDAATWDTIVDTEAITITIK